MAIRRNDRRRLARLAMPLVAAKRDEVEHRAALRESLAFFQDVAMLLAIEGVDPETTSVVIRRRDAEAKLAAIPDTPELQRADEDYLARIDALWLDGELDRGRRYRPPASEEQTFESEIERLMGRYRSDSEIDIATASPVDLLAWCLSRHGANFDEAADEVAKAAKDLQLLLDQLPDDPTEEDIERLLSAEENQ
jgi:hypothetical protein